MRAHSAVHQLPRLRRHSPPHAVQRLRGASHRLPRARRHAAIRSQEVRRAICARAGLASILRCGLGSNCCGLSGNGALNRLRVERQFLLLTIGPDIPVGAIVRAGYFSCASSFGTDNLESAFVWAVKSRVRHRSDRIFLVGAIVRAGYSLAHHRSGRIFSCAPSFGPDILVCIIVRAGYSAILASANIRTGSSRVRHRSGLIFSAASRDDNAGTLRSFIWHLGYMRPDVENRQRFVGARPLSGRREVMSHGCWAWWGTAELGR